MNIKKISGMLLLTVFCAVGFTGNAQQVAPLTFNVYVSVEGLNQEEMVKALVKSYISRELRNLGDVVINSQNVPYTHSLLLMVAEPEWVGAGKSGFVIVSATFTEFIEPLLEISPILETHVNQDTLASIGSDFLIKKGSLLSVSAYRQMFLAYGGMDDIQNICKLTVASFDGTTLQATREKQ